jgi:hypothetical protein
MLIEQEANALKVDTAKALGWIVRRGADMDVVNQHMEDYGEARKALEDSANAITAIEPSDAALDEALKTWWTVLAKFLEISRVMNSTYAPSALDNMRRIFEDNTNTNGSAAPTLLRPVSNG